MMRRGKADHSISAVRIQWPGSIGIDDLRSRAKPRRELKVDHLNGRARHGSLQELAEVAATGGNIDQSFVGHEWAMGEQLGELGITGSRGTGHRLMIEGASLIKDGVVFSGEGGI